MPHVHPLRSLALAVLAGGAALFAMGLVRTTGDVGPGRAEIRAEVSSRGGTTLALPPLGRVSAATHDAPVALDATVEELDLDRLQKLLADDDPEGALREEAARDLGPLLRRFALRVLLVAVLAGGAVGVVVPGRHWRHVLVGGLAGAVAALALLGGAWTGYDATAFDQASFDGPIERAPDVVDAVKRQVDDLGEVRDRVRTLGDRLASLYALASGPSAAPNGDDVRILHVTDLHLNPLGIEIARDLARRFDVAAVLDTGDLTSFGLPVEARVGRLVGRMPVPYYYVSGNHDSAAARRAIDLIPGVTVLDSDVATVGGVRILGVGDPTFTATNETDTAEARAAKEELAPAVAEAVRALRPDVLAVHDTTLAEASLGEVPLVVAGHVHERDVAVTEGTTVITGGSTGATGLGSFTVDADLPYEASVLHFRDGLLVTIDFLSLEGVTGSFRLERRVLDPPAGAELSLPSDHGPRR